jgi:hypothetical protein
MLSDGGTLTSQPSYTVTQHCDSVKCVGSRIRTMKSGTKVDLKLYVQVLY